MIGQQISHYRIVRRIGEGGMGEVYLAQDLTLDRLVALKFPLRDQLGDEHARKRLMREAQAAAGLDHPFVCKVFEVDDADGQPFIAMEYVDGTTLKERIAAGPLPLADAVRIALEMAEAIDAAHRKGLVHRDLKPANVMIGADGHVKVMDFGLAKRLAGPLAGNDVTMTAMTAAGQTTGTLAYMSPEQLHALPVDARSDVFAFGVILFEMLAGVHPFGRSSAITTAAAILNDPAPPLSQYVEHAPPVLEHILSRLLAKEPGDRHQSLRETQLELAAALTAKPGVTATATATPPRTRRWPTVRRPWTAVAVLAGLAAATIALWVGLRPFSEPALAFKERDWILIADVENMTGDPVFDRSLRLALEVGIAQSKYVNVLPRDRIKSVLRRMQQDKAEKIDEALAANIAVREEHVRAVLVCNIAQVGKTYSLTARVIDPATQNAVLTESTQARDKDHVLAALDELAVRVRSRLGESLDGLTQQRVPLPVATTSSLEALKLYADATRGATQDEGAIYTLLLQALTLDPNFALAHVELGRNYYFDQSSERRKKGEEHFVAAEKLLDRVTARERFLIKAGIADARGNREAAAREYTAYLAQYPDDASAWFRLGWIYMAALGRYEGAIDAFTHAITLNPLESATYINLATCHAALHQNMKAVQLYETAFAQTPEFRTDILINHEYGFTLVELGRLDDAAHMFGEMKASPDPAKRARGSRSTALLEMYRGRYAAAGEELRRAIRLDQTNKAGVSEYRDRLFLVRSLEARGLAKEAAAEMKEVDALISRLSLGPEWLRVSVKIWARRGDVATARRFVASMAKNAGVSTAASSIARNTDLDRPYIEYSQGEIELAQGHAAKAVEIFEAAHGQIHRPETLESLAAALRMSGRADDAAKRYEELLTEKPFGSEAQEDWLQAHVVLARIREQQGRTADARALCDELLGIWKNAEPDTALLKEARALRDRL